MSLSRRLALPFTIILGLAIAACGQPPDREMQQAQGAIDAARAAGADQYAHEDFVAAQEALTRAEEAVLQRDYRLALNHALDSREHAQNAAKLAADGKAAARVEADRAISALSISLDDIRARLKSPEAQRLPARTLAEPQQAIAETERQLQEARTAFEAGDYAGVVAKASAATSTLSAAERQVEAALPSQARRRR
jgi:hypothetical protein